MFRYICFLFFILFLSSKAISSHNLFEAVYGKAKVENGRWVQELSDGSFVLLGNTTSFGIGDQNFYLVKIDSLGNLIWEKNHGDTLDDNAMQFVVMPDGGFIIIGATNGAGAGGYDFYVVRTNSSGDTVWTKTYGGTSDDFGNAIRETSDGGYILAGRSKSFGPGSENFWIVRIDSQGTKLWDASYGGTTSQQANGIVETYDHGFAIIGSTKSFGAGNSDIYIVRTDSDGVQMWDTTFGMALNDLGYHIEEAPDSGLLILGVTLITSDTSKITVAKIDKMKNILWTKYPQRKVGDRGLHMLVDYSGGIVVVGYTISSGDGPEVLLMRLDANGDTILTQHFGSTSNDLGFGMTLTLDMGYLLIGQTDGFGVSNNDIYIIKTDTLGVIECAQSVSFTVPDSNVCINDLVDFTNTSVSSSNFSWEINGSPSSTGHHFSNVFDSAGTFLVELKNCVMTFSVNITVNLPPVAGFSCSLDSNNLTAIFTMDTGFTTTSFSWNFGDGSALDTSNQNPMHIYSNPGPYYVQLIITDINGCIDTAIKQINFIVTGLKTVLEKGLLSVYPNPLHTGGELNVILPGNDIASLDIFDVLGKRIISRTKSTTSISTYSWQRGIYYIRVTDTLGRIYQTKISIL